jgi:hypothetical protein
LLKRIKICVCLPTYGSIAHVDCPLFHFLNPYTVGRTPWVSQSQGRYLHTEQQKQIIHAIQTSMPLVGFEPTTAAIEDGSYLRPCPSWQRRASTCGRALLPHADKHMSLYVLELCKSEAKRAGRGKKCTPASGSSTLPRRTRPNAGFLPVVYFWLCGLKIHNVFIDKFHSIKRTELWY